MFITESGNNSNSGTAANITAQPEGEVIEEAKIIEIRLDVTVVEMTARGMADQAQQVGMNGNESLPRNGSRNRRPSQPAANHSGMHSSRVS